MDINIDYYKVLGLNKESSDSDIKKQYKTLSKIHHPDISGGNEDKFKEINNAYSVLSDTNKKQEYDTRSPHGNAYSPFGGFGGFGGGSSFEFNFNGDDLFSKFFGGGGFNPFGNAREEFRENLDLNLVSTINLKKIYEGTDLIIKYKRFVHCEHCNGTGFDKTGESFTCDVCNGKGVDNGKNCEYCQGEGKIYNGECKHCNGNKVVEKDTEVTLQNVSHIRNSLKNIHRGYGSQSKYYREKIGSLILTINVDRNDKYTIINNDELHTTLNIHYQDAIDGSEILYEHIDNTKIKLKLPEKTKDGETLKVKEKGLLRNNNKRADLYIKINIIIDYSRTQK